MTEKKINKEIKENIVTLPEGVSCIFSDDTVILEKNGVKQDIPYNHVYVSLEQKGNDLIIIPNSKKKPFVSVSKTLKKIINNAIEGFEREFVCKMQITYKHFPITTKIEDNKFKIINFYGEKKPREIKIAKDVKVDVKGKDIIISGKNKQLVGQVAGNIEARTRLKRKDYRVFHDGIYIVEKVK